MSSFVDLSQKEKRMDLMFSVGLKRSTKQATILFILEHKSGPYPDLLLQMLEYQTGIYRKTKKLNPIIPILVYHGKAKTWKGPFKFSGRFTGDDLGVSKEI